MEKEIRIRASLAIIRSGCILLVPHYHTDAGDIQWTIPGGKVEYGENLCAAAVREFREETGLEAEIIDLLDISEIIHLDRPYHSITITFYGKVLKGEERSEVNHPFGEKVPRWLRAEALENLTYHPKKTVEKAFDRWTQENESLQK